MTVDHSVRHKATLAKASVAGGSKIGHAFLSLVVAAALYFDIGGGAIDLVMPTDGPRQSRRKRPLPRVARPAKLLSTNGI